MAGGDVRIARACGQFWQVLAGAGCAYKRRRRTGETGRCVSSVFSVFSLLPLCRQSATPAWLCRASYRRAEAFLRVTGRRANESLLLGAGRWVLATCCTTAEQTGRNRLQEMPVDRCGSNIQTRTAQRSARSKNAWVICALPRPSVYGFLHEVWLARFSLPLPTGMLRQALPVDRRLHVCADRRRHADGTWLANSLFASSPRCGCCCCCSS